MSSFTHFPNRSVNVSQGAIWTRPNDDADPSRLSTRMSAPTHNTPLLARAGLMHGGAMPTFPSRILGPGHSRFANPSQTPWFLLGSRMPSKEQKRLRAMRKRKLKRSSGLISSRSQPAANKPRETLPKLKLTKGDDGEWRFVTLPNTAAPLTPKPPQARY